ncbi:hypothetical protein SISSUDRAFT_525212 [Sistotremastrum suecicum HHB10207 ss-3]|uniref:Uncharacterized protein n=1 Tax=Sistotremastrum suecicum HHB10207 ss-3 TaxID=1314776 RepID=A0A166F6D7_9AGAM|nr:hypothetical protein SISSUDRAFT_525212 [Sistotremastrum suecicum HHB10207 ss-3]
MIVDSVTELSSDAPMPAQAIPSTEHDTIISTFTTSSADIEIIPNPVQRTTIDLTTSSSLPPSSPPSGYQIASSITQSSSPVAIRRAASVLSDAVHAPGDNEDVVENHSVMAEIEILEHERDATLVMIDSVIISGERHEEKVKKLRLVRGLVRVALGCEDVAL